MISKITTLQIEKIAVFSVIFLLFSCGESSVTDISTQVKKISESNSTIKIKILMNGRVYERDKHENKQGRRQRNSPSDFSVEPDKMAENFIESKKQQKEFSNLLTNFDNAAEFITKDTTKTKNLITYAFVKTENHYGERNYVPAIKFRMASNDLESIKWKYFEPRDLINLSKISIVSPIGKSLVLDVCRFSAKNSVIEKFCEKTK